MFSSGEAPEIAGKAQPLMPPRYDVGGLTKSLKIRAYMLYKTQFGKHKEMYCVIDVISLTLNGLLVFLACL